MLIMELNSAVDNPAHDGRVRGGWKSARQFKKGERFVLLGRGDDLAVRFTEQEGEAVDQRVVVALLAHAKPTEPRSFSEVAAALPEGVTAGTVLDNLMRAGVVTADDIRKHGSQA